MTPDGVLHLQKSGNLAAGDKVTVTASTAYVNPSDNSKSTDYTATFTATVSAPETETAKESFVETNSNLV